MHQSSRGSGRLLEKGTLAEMRKASRAGRCEGGGQEEIHVIPSERDRRARKDQGPGMAALTFRDGWEGQVLECRKLCSGASLPMTFTLGDLGLKKPCPQTSIHMEQLWKGSTGRTSPWPVLSATLQRWQTGSEGQARPLSSPSNRQFQRAPR